MDSTGGDLKQKRGKERERERERERKKQEEKEKKLNLFTSIINKKKKKLLDMGGANWIRKISDCFTIQSSKFFDIHSI
jgi:hypothetical protein